MSTEPSSDSSSTSRALPSGSVDAQRFVLRGPDGSEASIGEIRTGFSQGFVFELLDLANPGTPLEVHVLVLNPTAYTLSEPFQSTLTPTEADTVIAEENGIIIREITLAGTYGLAPKTARGFIGAQGGGQALSGTEHFNKLRNLFRRYSALKKDPNRSANIQLIFHALRDDDHFVVVPRVFDTPREAQKTRVHYEYRITLAAIDEAVVSGLRAQPDTSGYDFTDAVRDINEAFNDARAAVAEVTANLAQIRQRVGNIQAVIGNAAQLLNAVGGFVSGATSLINYPLQLAATVTNQLADAGDQLIDSLDGSTYGVLTENARSLCRLEAAVDRIAMYDDRFQATAQNIEDFFQGERGITNDDVAQSGTSSAPGAGGVTVGSRTRTVTGSDGRLAGLDIPRRDGLRLVAVRRTDSIESIAAAAGTTPEAIIVINDLAPPYIVPGGGPGFVQPGDTVLVPASQGTGRATGHGAVDYLTPEEALYGVDIALAPGAKFDIAVETMRGGFDFEVVTGVANIVQGTEITVNTDRGTTQFIPDLGLRRNVGTKGTMQHVLLASIALREALLSDSRISGIESARVVLEGDVLTQEITPVVSGARPGATLVLPFGRASSGA